MLYIFQLLQHQFQNVGFMNCHFSCSTCVATTFTDCLTCPSQSDLSYGACFCSIPWDSSCTTVSALRPIFQITDSLFLATIPLIMLCYCLQAKLMISYRVLVGFQSISMLLFTNQSYLNYESIFGLTSLYKSNGYYGFAYRNQNLSISFILPAIYLFFAFLILYLILYKARDLFVKKQQNYCDYLKNNAYSFLNYFYTFASRSMLYFIGMWLAKMEITLINLFTIIISSLIILLILIKSIRDFHNNNLQEQIYQPQLYLYNILSPLPIIALPLATSTIVSLIVYIAPIALLFFIIIFNKNYQIFTKSKSIFYIIEAVIASLAIAFILLDYTIKGIIVLIATIIGILIIIIQTSISYYGGYNLRDSKIYPETKNTTRSGVRQQKITQSQIDKNIFKNSYKRQNSYF